MPKLGMAPVRRRQLVDATIASIHEFGLADTTVTRIAKKAGMSPGIVHHYFTDKDELLFESMRLMLQNLRSQAIVRLRKACTPKERINAIIEASFASEQLAPQVATAWLALYASARQSKSLTRILTLYHHRLRSNLIYNLKQISPSANHAQLAEAIAALIDGLYLRGALNPALYKATSPKTIVSEFVQSALTKGSQYA